MAGIKKGKERGVFVPFPLLLWVLGVLGVVRFKILRVDYDAHRLGTKFIFTALYLERFEEHFGL